MGSESHYQAFWLSWVCAYSPPNENPYHCLCYGAEVTHDNAHAMITSIEKRLVSCDPAMYKFLSRARNGIYSAYRQREADKRYWVITEFDVDFDSKIASTGL
jgi:hypothetical protein